MMDFSLWELRGTAVIDFIRSYSIDTTDFLVIYLLGFFLVTSALLGFGFYLWHLKSSNEHTRSRLLNILNGYLSAACMSCSSAVLNMMIMIMIGS